MIESRQDSQQYDSKQIQGGVSAGVSVIGSGSYASVNGSLNQGKLNYAQVETQSGLHAGEAGLTVNVAGNTHLKGAIVDSQASQEKNRFTTGSLTSENIENHSEAKVESIGGGLSTDPTQNIANGFAAGLSALGNINKQDSSTTHSAIGSNIQLTTQQGEIPTTLSRDTATANKRVQKADMEEMKARQEMAQVIGEIANNSITLLVKPKVDEAERQKAEAEAILKNDEHNQAAQQQLDTANKVIKTYGQGGQIQLAVRAVTGVLQGIATGEASQAVVGGLSPYANYAIKEATTDENNNVNLEANLMAHALLGAIEAYATGNNAAAGAAGAVSGELAAKIITEQLYQKSPEQLTEAQKQTVSTLSQLASGLVGGLVGDSTSSAISAAEIGKRAVENNSLLVDQFRAAKKADAESWKQNVRDIFGEGATSQLINGAINVIEETSDGALFLIDGGFDTLATITTCAVKDSYCDQAKQDLSSKNQVISDAVNSLMNGSYWNAIQTTAIQAYQGDQKALEDISGLIIGVLTPTVKGISKKGTLDNFAYRVSEELDSIKHLPIVGESLGYENQVANISISRGAENIALYPKLKEQLIQENLMNIVKNNPILEHAAFGNGNLTTPGIVDKKVLDNLAKDWVGENYKINSDGSFVSADGTRRYRPPKLKKYSPYAKTGIQANFERGYMDNKQRFHSISNQHINVKE